MSEKKMFNVTEVLAALEAAVALKGEDYVYEKEARTVACLYVHDRHTDNPVPGCIAGQVYYDLTGELVPALLEIGLGDGAAPSHEWLMEGTFTRGAILALGVAQEYQDNGNTWGKALAAARRWSSSDDTRD